MLTGWDGVPLVPYFRDLTDAPVVLGNDANAGLNTRYDLIGFDPRGVGYSTQVNCPPPAGGGQERPIGPIRSPGWMVSDSPSISPLSRP